MLIPSLSYIPYLDAKARRNASARARYGIGGVVKVTTDADHAEAAAAVVIR